MANILSRQLSSNEVGNVREIKTSLLKVRGKTLVFGNSIYQIPNLSGIEVINLSTTRSLPKYFWVIPIIGLGLLLIGYLWSIATGVLLLGASGYWFYVYLQNRLNKSYGLRIILNAGTAPVIVANDEEFLKRVAFALYNIMNNDEFRDMTFNIDRRKIDVKGVSGSTVVVGSVSGDIVNSV